MSRFMTRSAAQATTNYTLNKGDQQQQSAAIGTALKRLAPLLTDEKRTVAIAVVAMVITNLAGLLGPVIIARTVDRYIQNKDYRGVLISTGVLLAVYLCGLLSSYYQTLAMGTVGRTVLFKLRNTVFTKLQQLPLLFFNQNKAGDLISRINNDTDKLNQFFSQALVQMTGNLFMMTGAAIFLLALNVPLGLGALAPAAGVLIFTQLISGWIKRKNLKSLQSLGGMSAEIQESLANFKVIVAFNRLDYFRQKFNGANERNFAASVQAGLATNIFVPVYGLAFNLAQLVVLTYGVTLVGAGSLTVGVLIGFLLYVNSFYFPLRQLAAVWASFQIALAGLDRISAVQALESNMPVVAADAAGPGALLEFEHVDFSYPGGQHVLTDATFALE